MTASNKSDGWKEATGSTWKPEKKDDSIEGLLTDIQSEVGQNSSMLYTVCRKEDGENLGVWGSTVLDSRMRGINIGEEVKIVFKGLGDAKPGKHAPKLFSVFHREPK